MPLPNFNIFSIDWWHGRRFSRRRQMTSGMPKQSNFVTRRSFMGGSDARIIMGSDEAALLRLWREKRGEAEPEDLSGNLVVPAWDRD